MKNKSVPRDRDRLKVRGGAWHVYPDALRPAVRYGFYRDFVLGFRIVKAKTSGK